MERLTVRFLSYDRRTEHFLYDNFRNPDSIRSRRCVALLVDRDVNRPSNNWTTPPLATFSTNFRGGSDLLPEYFL